MSAKNRINAFTSHAEFCRKVVPVGSGPRQNKWPINNQEFILYTPTLVIRHIFAD